MTQPEVRTPTPLRTLHGIELAAVGTWKAMTGETTFTSEDLANAVAALQCPGVRNPVLKLGHAEPDPDSGVRWDGEPAVGWVANMRFDGAKLLGDFTGMPAWLADADENGLSVLAAGYPDRSVEIYRPFECQIGHLHPSVIGAVSLLGIYAPGIGVLKSMQDVYAAFTQPAAPAKAMLSTTVTLAAATEPRELTDIEKRSGVDFGQAQEQWDTALNDLLDQWPDISQAQRDELTAQVAEAVDKEPDRLGRLTVDSAAAAAALSSVMVSVAIKAAHAQIAEGKKQGVTLTLPDITEDTVADVAGAVTSTMAAGTAAMAGRTAAQALGVGTGADIANLVGQGFDALTDRFLRDQLGGALSAAQHRGRIAVLDGWDGDVTLYASEVNDGNACENCRSIDGTRFDSRDAAESAYGGGKYVSCLGGARCRGQIIALFGSDAARASALQTTIRTDLGGQMPAVVKASVTVEDISRQYYESAGYSMWICEMQVDPLQLIAADDSTGKFYRIPVELKGKSFAFGDPQEVAMNYVDVKSAASAPIKYGDRQAAFAAAGVTQTEAGDYAVKPDVAPDVSPAGAAIRKAVAKSAATVLETEVPAVEPTDTPDAEPAAGPITNPKEASVDAAKMREALGLGPDASDRELAEALSAQLSSATPPPQETDRLAVLMSRLPDGEKPIVIDPENYKALLAMGLKGERAYAEMQKTRMETVLETAMKDGRFPVARLATYREMWEKNPEATEQYISLMPKQTVPTMAAGVFGAEISQNETDMAHDAVYGKAGA
jgi:hypothetical protein